MAEIGTPRLTALVAGVPPKNALLPLGPRHVCRAVVPIQECRGSCSTSPHRYHWSWRSSPDPNNSSPPDAIELVAAMATPAAIHWRLAPRFERLFARNGFAGSSCFSALTWSLSAARGVGLLRPAGTPLHGGLGTRSTFTWYFKHISRKCNTISGHCGRRSSGHGKFRAGTSTFGPQSHYHDVLTERFRWVCQRV